MLIDEMAGWVVKRKTSSHLQQLRSLQSDSACTFQACSSLALLLKDFLVTNRPNVMLEVWKASQLTVDIEHGFWNIDLVDCAVIDSVGIFLVVKDGELTAASVNVVAFGVQIWLARINVNISGRCPSARCNGQILSFGLISEQRLQGHILTIGQIVHPGKMDCAHSDYVQSQDSCGEQYQIQHGGGRNSHFVQLFRFSVSTKPSKILICRPHAS